MFYFSGLSIHVWRLFADLCRKLYVYRKLSDVSDCEQLRLISVSWLVHMQHPH